MKCGTQGFSVLLFFHELTSANRYIITLFLNYCVNDILAAFTPYTIHSPKTGMGYSTH